MKTIKIIGLVALSLLMSVGGTVFAASFAVETLQSWPKALIEARVVLMGQLLLGFALGYSTGRLHKYLNIATLVVMVLVLCTSVWYLGEIPHSRFHVCMWGIYSYVLVGGLFIGELIRQTSRGHCRPKTIVAIPPERLLWN